MLSLIFIEHKALAGCRARAGAGRAAPRQAGAGRRPARLRGSARSGARSGTLDASAVTRLRRPASAPPAARPARRNRMSQDVR